MKSPGTRTQQPLSLEEAFSLLPDDRGGISNNEGKRNSLILAEALSKQGVEKLIVVGDSLVPLPIAMALLGKEVVYVSLPGETATFDLTRTVTQSSLKRKFGDREIDIKKVIGEFGSVDLEKEDLEQERYDLITLVDLLGGIPVGEPKEWMARAKELLKPNGLILLDETGPLSSNLKLHFEKTFPNHELVDGPFEGSRLYNPRDSKNMLYRINKSEEK